MGRRISALLGPALALLLVCGCSSGASLTGKYLGYALAIPGLGDPEPMSSTYDKGENYVELKDGGEAILCLDGDPVEASYAVDGERITITMGEGGETYDSEGTVRDGVLTFDIVGIGFELTFVKEGAQAPFDVIEGGIAAGMVDADGEAPTPLDVTVADDDIASIRVSAKADYLGDPALVLAIENRSEREVLVTTPSGSSFLVAGSETRPYLNVSLGSGEQSDDAYLWWDSSEVADVAALVEVSGRIVVLDAQSGEELSGYDLSV